MDTRRLSTADILVGGILNVRPPKTAIPDDRERVEGQGDDWAYIGNEAVVAALDAGKVVSAPNYYGIPHVWKASEGVYRGTLLQYRAITEDETFTSAESAAEWFEEMYYRTDG
jgi:hypothetical protein